MCVLCAFGSLQVLVTLVSLSVSSPDTFGCLEADVCNAWLAAFFVLHPTRTAQHKCVSSLLTALARGLDVPTSSLLLEFSLKALAEAEGVADVFTLGTGVCC